MLVVNTVLLLANALACRVVYPQFRESVLPTFRCVCGMCYRPVSAASFAACAICFSLRAMFRVCHDFDSVFGFGFSFLCDSRLGGVVVDAMYSSFSFVCQAIVVLNVARWARPTAIANGAALIVAAMVAVIPLLRSAVRVLVVPVGVPLVHVGRDSECWRLHSEARRAPPLSGFPLGGRSRSGGGRDRVGRPGLGEADTSGSRVRALCQPTSDLIADAPQRRQQLFLNGVKEAIDRRRLASKIAVTFGGTGVIQTS